MKKFLSLFLASVLSLSFFAGCTDPDSTDSSQTSDSSAEETLPEGSVTNEDLSQALSTQFQETASMKVNFEIHDSLLSVKNYYETDGDGNPTTTPALDIYYQESKHTAEAVFSIGTDNKLDGKIDTSLEEADWMEDELELTTESSLYIIDNTAYLWNKDVEAWIRAEELTQTVTQIAEAVKAIESSNLLTQAEQAKLFAGLGEFINVAFDVKEFKGTLAFDGKTAASDFFTYFEELDTEAKTLSAVFDDGLKLINKDLTTAKLLAKVQEVGALTVNEAVAEIDAWLTQNYQTTLQGIYDHLVGNEVLMNFVLDMAGVEPEAKAEMMTNLKAFKLTDKITEMEIGEVPLYDFIMSLVASGQEYVSMEDLFTRIENTLALTIAEFEANGEYVPIFSLLKESAPYFTVNKLDGKLDLEFTNTFSIESVYGEFNVDIENSSPSEVEGENDMTALTWKAAIEISEISKDALAIAIPTEDTVYDFYADGYYESSEGDLNALYIQTYEEEASFELWGTLPAGFDVSIEAAVPVSALTSPTIEVAPENVEIYVDSQLHEVTLDKSIIVEIVGEKFIIKQLPDLGLAEHDVYQALQSIEDGKTDYTIDPDLGITAELWTGSNTGQIFYADTNPLSTIIFEFERNYKTGEMVCTIVGYSTDGHLVDTETGIGYIGSIPEQIPTLFGGDIEFTFYVTADGVITCDDMPTILPQYIK